MDGGQPKDGRRSVPRQGHIDQGLDSSGAEQIFTLKTVHGWMDKCQTAIAAVGTRVTVNGRGRRGQGKDMHIFGRCTNSRRIGGSTREQNEPTAKMSFRSDKTERKDGAD